MRRAPAARRDEAARDVTLDRYVISEFWKIFLTTAFGFPVLVIIVGIVTASRST